MIEAYRIATSLFLESNITTALPRMTELFEALSKVVKQAQTGTAELGAALRGVGRAEPGIRTLAASMERLHQAQTRAAASAASLNRAMSDMPAGGAAGAAYGAAAGAAAAASAARGSRGRAAAVLVGGALVPYVGPGANLPPAPQYASSAAASAGGLVAPSTALATTPRGPIPLNWPGYGPAGNGPSPRSGPPQPSSGEFAQAGLGFGLVGEALIGGVRHAMTPAIDVNRTLDVLGADTRLTPSELQSALQTARDNTRSAPGSTVGENLASILDLKNVFGTLEEAKKLSPEFARMTTLLQTMDRRHGGSGEQSFAAAKAMEIMGAMTSERMENGKTIREMDPDKGMEYLKRMERVAVATNMRVAPSDYLGFAKQARVAGMTLSDEFTFEKLPALLQVLGGQRTGTALMSMAQVFDGGKQTASSMKAMIDLGLADSSGLETHVGGRRNRRGEMVGGRTVVHSDRIFDQDIMRHDLLAYVEAASRRMDAKGIHGSEDQIRALMNMAQRSTIAGILADLLKHAPAIHKEQENIRNTRPDMAQRMAESDPAAKVQQFHAALTNLATAFGGAGMSDAMKVLDAITNSLKGMGQWAEKNPGLARLLFDVTAGLGALAAAAGLASVTIFLGSPMIKAMQWLASAEAVAAGANVLAFGNAMGTAAGLARIAITGLLAYAAGTALQAGLDAGGGKIGDLVHGAMGETPQQRDARHDYWKQAEDARSRFSIFDRSTWADPKGSWLTAAPRMPPMPGANGQPIELRGNINIDGRKVGEGVFRNVSPSGPNTGTTGYDIRTGLAGTMPQN